MTAKEILNEYWDSLIDENKKKLTEDMGVKWLTLSKEGKILGHIHAFPYIGDIDSDGVDWYAYNCEMLSFTFKADVDGYDTEVVSLIEELTQVVLKEYTFNAETGELTIKDINAYKNDGCHIVIPRGIVQIDKVDDFIHYNDDSNKGELCYWVTCLPETDGVALIFNSIETDLKEYEDEVKDFKQCINKLNKHIKK